MVENALQNNPDARHALRAAPAAHGVNFLLRRVEHAGRAACAVLHHGGNFPRYGIERAQQRLVAYDADVFHHVCARGRHVHQLGEVRARRAFLIGAVFLHLARDGHAVDGLGVDEHGVDRLEDLAVLL